LRKKLKEKWRKFEEKIEGRKLVLKMLNR
jgi:hypothetical protein